MRKENTYIKHHKWEGQPKGNPTQAVSVVIPAYGAFIISKQQQ